MRRWAKPASTSRLGVASHRKSQDPMAENGWAGSQTAPLPANCSAVHSPVLNTPREKIMSYKNYLILGRKDRLRCADLYTTLLASNSALAYLKTMH
jgi:L-asparaginase II